MLWQNIMAEEWPVFYIDIVSQFRERVHEAGKIDPLKWVALFFCL
jgi:hypothetical protein